MKTSHLDFLARLNINANVLHDWNVQLMKNTDDSSFASGGADCIVKRFHIYQELNPVRQTVLSKGFNSSEKNNL